MALDLHEQLFEDDATVLDQSDLWFRAMSNNKLMKFTAYNGVSKPLRKFCTSVKNAVSSSWLPCEGANRASTREFVAYFIIQCKEPLRLGVLKHRCIYMIEIFC